MNIALIGYGKMGRKIEQIAIAKGHYISLKINSSNLGELTAANLRKADVAIDFTRPEAAAGNVMLCLEAGIPVVSGTTGWDEELAGVVRKVTEMNGALLHASNFSIGVNLFFEVNKALAALMNEHSEYDIAIEEIHHTEKKDAPSGTAIRLAEQVIDNMYRKTVWIKEQANQPDDLVIKSFRIDDVPGTHAIKYTSAIDDIEIVHTAHNRDGFASGAVLAAEYIVGKQGIFTMKDVLGIR